MSYEALVQESSQLATEVRTQAQKNLESVQEVERTITGIKTALGNAVTDAEAAFTAIDQQIAEMESAVTAGVAEIREQGGQHEAHSEKNQDQVQTALEGLQQPLDQVVKQAEEGLAAMQKEVTAQQEALQGLKSRSEAMVQALEQELQTLDKAVQLFDAAAQEAQRSLDSRLQELTTGYAQLETQGQAKLQELGGTVDNHLAVLDRNVAEFSQQVTGMCGKLNTAVNQTMVAESVDKLKTLSQNLSETLRALRQPAEKANEQMDSGAGKAVGEAGQFCETVQPVIAIVGPIMALF